eukprot:12661705-Heterocapsa_arctica.AAC.1
MLKVSTEAHTIGDFIPRRSTDELERGADISTLNLSGSLFNFEWLLENTQYHILLIQEQWRLPNKIESWKSAAFRKGWT